MDKGVEFALDNFEKILELTKRVKKYRHLRPKVFREYHYVKSIKYTGNLYEHFLKYQDGKNQHAKDFEFLNEYGLIPNEKMADYLKKNYPDELNNFWTIEDLKIGERYSNNEIAIVFGCSDRQGMRRSKKTNSLVLIANHNNLLYDDQWNEDGILHYTGMGMVGNQKMASQNKTLKNAKRDGIKVYLFESYKKNEYIYHGEVELCTDIYVDQGVDINGDLRNVYKFPLKRLDDSISIVISNIDIENSRKKKLKDLKKLSKEGIKNRAKKVSSNSNTVAKEITTTYRERNTIIAQYTKDRANGVCDLCGNPAPFYDKKGNPYLESHHVITLAEGGPDVIYNTVALCPNCHRKVHNLHSKADLRLLEKVILKYLLDDEDEKSIAEYKELFKD